MVSMLERRKKLKKKRNIMHLWSFPQRQDIPFLPIFFSHYLLNFPEINMEVAYHLEKHYAARIKGFRDTAGGLGAAISF